MMEITQKKIAPLLPSILSQSPQKVNEIATKVATQLGLPSLEAGGVYAGGKLKLPTLATNALNALSKEGKATKIAHGRWVAGGVAPVAPVEAQEVEQAPAPVVKAPVAPAPVVKAPVAPVVKAVVAQEDPQGEPLYEIKDPIVFSRVASATSCYGTFAKSDSACGTCLLASACKQMKKALSEAKKREKEVANTTTWTLPSDVSVTPEDVTWLVNQNPIPCHLSGNEIKVGENICFLPDYGVVCEEVAKALGFEPS